ncbi:SDR family NAD(P)-dependent oxidoreductase [Streptomyces sp. NPDC058464]|uniref:SDR family NAD(P)-dependent oxidoreductase n=1 Tax=Streptomyces sp. NPDC058464 TaxID=3346511 RepID=UPI00364A9030
MDLELSKKRALVTGSSSGIGRAIAVMLAAEGANVVVHGRDRDRAAETADMIREGGAEADVVLGDLTDEQQTDAICRQLAESGGVDILVNNVGGRYGGWQRDEWFATSPNAWLESYRRNVIAATVLINALVPAMTRRRWGRVIQISSAVALHQPPHFPDYQAAKAAEINLSRSLAKALAGTGVTANCISAGIIDTPDSAPQIAEAAAGLERTDDGRYDERRLALDVFRQSVDRVGRPDDIAAAVCYLAGSAADFVTGVNLVVDGGI